MWHGSRATSRRCASARGCCATGPRPGLAGRARRIYGGRRGRGRGGRRDTVERLDRFARGAEGAFPRARLSLIGTLETWLLTMPALDAEERFREALAQSRRSDALSAAPAWAASLRSRVFHAEKGIAAEAASTGEQKALLIAILLAQAGLQRAVRGEPPLLLLDEVAAHLDSVRRAALFEVLAGLESQAWITYRCGALRPALRRRPLSDGR